MFNSPERRAKRLIKQTQNIPAQFREAAAALDASIAKSVKKEATLLRLGAKAHNAIHKLADKVYGLFWARVNKAQDKTFALYSLKKDSLKMAQAYDRLLNG